MGGAGRDSGRRCRPLGSACVWLYLRPYRHLSSPSSRFAPQPLHEDWGAPTAASALIHPPGRPPSASVPIFLPTAWVDKVGFLGDSPGDRPPCKDSHVLPCHPLRPPPPPAAHTGVPGPLPLRPQTLLPAQSTKASRVTHGDHPRFCKQEPGFSIHLTPSPGGTGVLHPERRCSVPTAPESSLIRGPASSPPP